MHVWILPCILSLPFIDAIVLFTIMCAFYATVVILFAIVVVFMSCSFAQYSLFYKLDLVILCGDLNSRTGNRIDTVTLEKTSVARDGKISHLLK